MNMEIDVTKTRTFTVTTREVFTSMKDTMTHEDIAKSVMELDQLVGDWNFTNMLIDYFKEQEKILESKLEIKK
jgi:hypothetical protein